MAGLLVTVSCCFAGQSWRYREHREFGHALVHGPDRPKRRLDAVSKRAMVARRLPRWKFLEVRPLPRHQAGIFAGPDQARWIESVAAEFPPPNGSDLPSPAVLMVITRHDRLCREDGVENRGGFGSGDKFLGWIASKNTLLFGRHALARLPTDRLHGFGAGFYRLAERAGFVIASQSRRDETRREGISGASAIDHGHAGCRLFDADAIAAANGGAEPAALDEDGGEALAQGPHLCLVADKPGQRFCLALIGENRRSAIGPVEEPGRTDFEQKPHR